MRVLLFTEAAAAGVGRHVMDLAEGLTGFGHECHVLYGIGRADNRFLARAAGLMHSLALTVRKHPHWSDLWVALRIRKYLQRNGPFDIIHAHSTKAGLLLRIAALGCPGAVLYTPHAPLTMNPMLPRGVRSIISFCELVLSMVTDRMIAVSREEADHLAECKIPRSKLAVVANGIVADDKAAICTAGVKSAFIRIGFLGRLSPQKNAAMLLSAFAAAFDRSSAVSLTIAGSGGEEGRLRAQADALGITERVNWIGCATSEVLASFDIFALPSSYEGMPYVLLESMAAGVPVVATAVGGVGSVMRNGLEGYIVPPGALERFAAALHRLASDRLLRERMSARAKQTAKRFTVDRMVAETLTVYSQAIRDADLQRHAVRTLPLGAD